MKRFEFKSKVIGRDPYEKTITVYMSDEQFDKLCDDLQENRYDGPNSRTMAISAYERHAQIVNIEKEYLER